MNNKSVALGCVFWTVFIIMAAAVFWDTPPIWHYFLRETLPYYGYSEAAREETQEENQEEFQEEANDESELEPKEENDEESDDIIVFLLNKRDRM